MWSSLTDIPVPTPWLPWGSTINHFSTRASAWLHELPGRHVADWLDRTNAHVDAVGDGRRRRNDHQRREACAPRWMEVAPGFPRIDPPIGFITIPGVPHVGWDGVTDFEAHLLGGSLAGKVVSGQMRAMLAASVLDHHRQSLDTMASTMATRVFAHIVAPHPPFVFSSDEGGACWPGCHLWVTTHERQHISVRAWSIAMGTQIENLNHDLIRAIDRMIKRRPDAAIVLMSDHGGRYSYADPQEWHRSFLAARTPGHPNLFAAEPHPARILPLLISTYDLDY